VVAGVVSAGLPPPELLTFDVEFDPRDPWSATRAHQAWCAARADWVAAGNVWPDDQRELHEALCMPDQPWAPPPEWTAQPPETG
jgi:hypothetical protein